jgi:hypothetical protein
MFHFAGGVIGLQNISVHYETVESERSFVGRSRWGEAPDEPGAGNGSPVLRSITAEGGRGRSTHRRAAE